MMKREQRRLIQKINSNDKYGEYAQGIRFYYHSYYKNNDARSELLPGSNLHDGVNATMNPSYKYKDWYIAPKFKSLRDEILHGAKNTLSIIEYENTLEIAKYKYKYCINNINKAISLWDIVYGIKRGSLIQFDVYYQYYLYRLTDSHKFSESFRKLKTSESDHYLKKTSSFYHWARQ